MSQYTTGELAKACGITVRTVQFYDQKGILIPGALTGGGRRLYSEEDLKRMKIICFLRDTGLSLDTIGRLLSEEDPGSVISILLDQQEQVLQEEIGERREKLERLEEIRNGLKAVSTFSMETISDIAIVMEGKKETKRHVQEHDPDRYSGDCPAMGVDPAVDFQGHLVAVSGVGCRGNGLWRLGKQVLLPEHGLYLSAVS